MEGHDGSLASLAEAIGRHPAFLEKATIQRAYLPAQPVCGKARLGDDAASLRLQGEDPPLLFASEGMLESFVARDPWFAGYSAVMVNVSDIAAMGGVPTALTITLWTDHSERSQPIWEGLRAASRAYGVPIVGGHTTRTAPGAPQHLAASILGFAPGPQLTSFAARPGDLLLCAVDLRGDYRLDQPFFDASTGQTPAALQSGLRLLPEVARRGHAHAAKDISNGGIVGTLAMLCATSKVGADLHLDHLPQPAAVPLLRWLLTFPSYGFLLAVAPLHEAATLSLFQGHGIACATAGVFTDKPLLRLVSGHETAPLPFSPAIEPGPGIPDRSVGS